METFVSRLSNMTNRKYPDLKTVQQQSRYILIFPFIEEYPQLVAGSFILNKPEQLH